MTDVSCGQCGKSFHPRRKSSRYCSRPCAWANNGKGQTPPDGTASWWVSNKGYIVGQIWENGRRKHVKQHRLIVEEHLGRKLRPDEDVHHINGIKTDNRIANLQVLPHKAHSRLTSKGRTYKRGYKLRISDADRKERSEKAKRQGLSELGLRARGIR